LLAERSEAVMGYSQNSSKFSRTSSLFLQECLHR
jgi:hypothetical protein